jgi:hypothetical protein
MVEPVVEHFGERLRAGKYGHRLSRETYAIPNRRPSVRLSRESISAELWATLDWAFADDEHTTYSDAYCEQQQADALENFDLNMGFFAGISADEFEGALSNTLATTKQLRPVTDLLSLDGVEGLYVMVLDEYRQAYVGKSTDMRRRIRSHWAGTKQFDRLLWGHKYESVMSIDTFQPLDTTRIFAAKTIRGYELERKVERRFPADFLLNRIWGGEMNGVRAHLIAAEVKRRQLLSAEGLG